MKLPFVIVTSVVRDDRIPDAAEQKFIVVRSKNELAAPL